MSKERKRLERQLFNDNERGYFPPLKGVCAEQSVPHRKGVGGIRTHCWGALPIGIVYSIFFAQHRCLSGLSTRVLKSTELRWLNYFLAVQLAVQVMETAGLGLGEWVLGSAWASASALEHFAGGLLF